MASGDIVGIVGDVISPQTSYATFSVRATGDSPVGNLPKYDFDDATTEYLDFYCRLEGYGGGGLTITWDWTAATATSGDVLWGAAIGRIQDDTDDVDGALLAAFNTQTDTAASAATSGERSRVSITFTDGADMDSLADGEAFILRIERVGGDASDTMSGDAGMWHWTLTIKET